MTRRMRELPRMVEGLTDLCRDIPKGVVGLEIGSFAGESAEIIMRSGHVKTLYCVDPWEAPPGRFAALLPDAEARFGEVLSRYPGIIKCKGVLADFRRMIPPVGFVYVDGNHQFGAVLRDILQALLFIQTPCLFAGHDYTHGHLGVMQAVSLVFPQAQLKLYKDGSWSYLIEKPEDMPI